MFVFFRLALELIIDTQTLSSDSDMNKISYPPTHTSSTRYHTHHQPPHHHISSLIHLVFTHRTHASPQYQFQHILIPYPIRPYSLLKYISTPLYNTYYIPIYPTTNMFLSSQTPSPILFSFVQHFPIIFLFPPYSSFQKTQHLSKF